MELTISKQYPFNFVALALETMGISFDERSLAKFDAYEVDVFLKDRCERSSSEKEAIEWFTSDRATPPKESYKESLVRLFRPSRINTTMANLVWFRSPILITWR